MALCHLVETWALVGFMYFLTPSFLPAWRNLSQVYKWHYCPLQSNTTHKINDSLVMVPLGLSLHSPMFDGSFALSLVQASHVDGQMLPYLHQVAGFEMSVSRPIEFSRLTHPLGDLA